MSTLSNHPARLEQCPEFQLKNPSKWTIKGHSRAGERTGFWVDPVKIVLDCGMSTYMRPKALFMSHSHTDHSTALPNILTSRSTTLKGQEDLMGRPVFMPRDAVHRVLALERAILTLSRPVFGREFKNDDAVWRKQGVHPFGVRSGDSHMVPGVPGLRVDVYPAYHDAESVGYGFTTIKNKLKSEYQELTESKEGRKQLKEIRESGTSITEDVEVPEMIFYCDSTINNLANKNGWKIYPVVICECTMYPNAPGFDDKDRPDVGETMRRAHTHFLQLLPIMQQNKDKQWILIHASMRMSDEELVYWENKLKEEEGIDVKIWTDIVNQAE